MKSGLVRVLFLAALGTASVVAPLAITSPVALADPQVSGMAVQAVKLALSGQFEDAGAMAVRSKDQAAIKLVELIYLRDHPKEAGYSRIMDFLDVAPDWPLTESLMKRAERTLWTNNEPAVTVLAHFGNRKPVTPEGMLALARAKLATGDRQTADRLVKQVWSDPDIDANLEAQAASEFKSLLNTDDYKARMVRLIYAQEPNAAIRASKRLSGDYQAMAKVAQGLLNGASGADKQVAKLPAAMKGEPAIKYALANYYRKRQNWSAARAVLASVPASVSAQADTDDWWVERRIVARHSIGPNHRDGYAQAYQIASAHGFTSGDGALEGEFLAGWIALRSLKDANRALPHFQKLSQLAETRTDKARAKYWLGRTYAVLKRDGDAKSAFREAAQYSTIYYGQLAREEIGLGSTPEEISSGQPSAAASAKIDKDELVRAFMLMAKAGSQKDLYMFLPAFAKHFDTVDEMNAAASVAWDVGGATMAVRLAKAAGPYGIDIDSWSYPVRALPDWKQIGKPVEKALVFGLSRQESEFNPTAGSQVGAQGLMQIMPGTAKIIAKQYGLTYKAGMLTSDPAYNVKLGAAHLGDLIDDFGGSYVLTLVAYNAGPRRSREWVAEYGDLRNGKVDPIDWVESIPFQETRQYVQKVLQNVHVYRSRLAPSTVKPMTADLSRGAAAPIKIASDGEDRPAKPACSGGSIAQLVSACE